MHYTVNKRKPLHSLIILFDTQLDLLKLQHPSHPKAVCQLFLDVERTCVSAVLILQTQTSTAVLTLWVQEQNLTDNVPTSLAISRHASRRSRLFQHEHGAHVSSCNPEASSDKHSCHSWSVCCLEMLLPSYICTMHYLRLDHNNSGKNNMFLGMKRESWISNDRMYKS